MNSRFRVALTLVIGFLLLCAAGFIAPSAGAANETGTVLTMSTSPRLDSKGHKIAGQYLVIVNLATSTGQPVTNRTVDIVERVQFVGRSREAALGAATLDSTGVGAIAYQPAANGTHTLIARFRGDADFAQSEVTNDMRVADAVPPFAQEPAPLASVRHWLGVGVVAFVAAFWIVLLGLALRTSLGLWQAGRVLEPAAGRSGEPGVVITPEGMVIGPEDRRDD
jgi:hypothetical protein